MTDPLQPDPLQPKPLKQALIKPVKTQKSVASSKIDLAFQKMDEVNAADPNLETNDEGHPEAKELLYSRRMSATLNTLYPDASEHLKLAARAQHIERWRSLRTDYPEGLQGYKKWRAELTLFHAASAEKCMKAAGYEQEDIDRVKYLIQKRQLKRDPETQALEDCICIVFLNYYFDDFIKKHSREKLIDIIQKTWKKMSSHGHTSALKLNFSTKALSLVEEALAQ